MPYDDDWRGQPDSHSKKLFDISDELSGRSARAIRSCQEAARKLKELLSKQAEPLDGSPPAEWTVTQEGSPGLVVVRGRGTFTVSSLRARVGDVIAIKDPLCPVLFDGSEMEVPHVSPAELIDLETILNDHILAFTFSRMAILIGTSAAGDLADSWARLASAGTRTRIKVFRDEHAARQWLAEP